MISFDSHLHTRFSSDSEADPRAYIKLAKEKGMKGICFTDHNDYDFPLEDGKVVFDLDFKAYLDYMLKLKGEFRGSFDIRVGVEQGLMKSVASRVDSYDPENKLDFIIGSSHLVEGEDPYYPSYWEGRAVKDTIIKYYESIMENIKTCHNFDIYGHLDYIIRYAPEKDANYNWKDYYDYFYEILKSLIYQGKGIEVNTAGLKYGLKNPNPDINIVKLYKELGGEIITVGSDSHSVDYLGYEFDRVYNMLKELGFKYYSVFKDRKAEFYEI